MKYLMITWTIIVTCVSCNNEKKGEQNIADNKVQDSGKTTAGDDAAVTFEVNGVRVNTRPLGINTTQTETRVMINIITDRETSPHTVNLTIPRNKPGKYSFASAIRALEGEGMCYGIYTPDAKSDALNVYSFIDGELELSIDTVSNIIHATFSGTTKNAKDEVIILKNGKIANARMNTLY